MLRSQNQINVARLDAFAERQRFAPWGLFGGQPGKPGVTLLNPGTPGERRIHSKASDTFEHGDVISFQQPGAGGYGPPWERDPRAVLRDVLGYDADRIAALRKAGALG